MDPKSPEIHPKYPQNAPKRLPRDSQDPPKSIQERSKRLQDASSSPPDHPNCCLGAFQSSQMTPKRLQEASKRLPRASKGPRKAPQERGEQVNNTRPPKERTWASFQEDSRGTIDRVKSAPRRSSNALDRLSLLEMAPTAPLDSFFLLELPLSINFACAIKKNPPSKSLALALSIHFYRSKRLEVALSIDLFSLDVARTGPESCT